MPEINLQSLTLSELFERLESGEQGLSATKAQERIAKFGLNEMAAKDKRTAAIIFISQFKSPLILVLVAASFIAGILGEPAETAIILAIVFINAGLGFYQEYKSEQALEELKKYISFKAVVLRDGEKTEINVSELVPGDIVFLNIGDIAPADMRLIEANDLMINQSVITGESFPVQKTIETLSQKETLPTQQANIAFMGTTVSSGRAKGIVVATGKNTEFGRTATILSAKEPPTDFQKNIKKFGNFLVKIVFILTAFVFATNTILGKGLLESFLFALALAVGITPELLPIIITISLSSAAMQLAKKKVVVKQLAAIEDLGNTDVLCIDKTGTLTENKITLSDYFDADGKKSIQLLEYALLCNSAIIENKTAKGNAIDVAIWEHAAQKEKPKTASYKKTGEIEFDYERRRMSVIVEKSGKFFLISKGAPESIMEKCSFVQKQGKKSPIKGHEITIKQKFSELSSQGFRVVAVAFKEIAEKKDYSAQDEKELVFCGFISFFDPPKKTAIEALKRFRLLGVEIKILTGDNELVTKQVCREVSHKIIGEIVLGSELEKLDEQEFLKTIQERNVFARITPEQKYRIVAGLSKQGHIVGFLGDGVNDAPALKAADIGITVDSAVDVAKESADIILLKKSLLVISEGIIDGRKTFGNITKYIFNTVSANFGNMLTLAISSIFLKFIPLLPAQILLTNLISDVPLMTISTDNVDHDYLHKPKRWSIKAISNFMLYFGVLSAIFDLLTIGILLLILKADPATFRTAWFIESVISEIIVTFAIRTKKNFWQSNPSKMLVYSSIAAITLSLLLIYSPIAALFEFEQLPITIIAAIGLVLLAYFTMAEMAKKRFYRKHEI